MENEKMVLTGVTEFTKDIVRIIAGREPDERDNGKLHCVFVGGLADSEVYYDGKLAGKLINKMCMGDNEKEVLFTQTFYLLNENHGE